MMKSRRVRTVAVLAISAVLWLSSCAKKEKPAATPSPAPGPAATTTPQPAKTPAESVKTPTPAAGPDHLELLPADALAVLTVRVGDMWTSDLAKKLRAEVPKEGQEGIKEAESKMGMSFEDIRRISVVMLSAPPAPPVGIVSVAKPVDRAKLKELVSPGAKDETIDGLSVYPLKDKKDGFVYVKDDHLFFLGPLVDIQKLLKGGNASGALSEALAMAKEHQFVAAANAVPLLKDLKKNPPQQAKGFAPLLEAQKGILTIDVTNDLSLNGRVLFPGQDDAKKAESILVGLIGMANMGAAQMLDKDQQMLKRAQDTLAAIAIKQDNDAVTLSFKAKGEDVVSAAKAAVPLIAQGASQAAGKAVGENNLKQIAIAMHNYHDATGSLPAVAIYSKEGKPLLSWRVALLPYLEQRKLYDQFKLDQPWDSPDNKKLLGQMPKVYTLPGAKERPGMTHLRVFHGPKAAFEGVKGLRLVRDFTDGLSYTILVVEAEQPVEWTKPDPLPFDAKKPLPKLGGSSPNGFLAVFADGSPHFIKKTVPESTLKALITRNGGEQLKPDDWNK